MSNRNGREEMLSYISPFETRQITHKQYNGHPLKFNLSHPNHYTYFNSVYMASFLLETTAAYEKIIGFVGFLGRE